MTLLSKLLLQATATQTNPLDLASGRFPVTKRKLIDMASGVGAGQADRMFTDQRTIAASGSEDLDLAGVLTDAFGATITFARIKALMITAADGNTNGVVVGAGTNAWAGFLGATHTMTLRPGTAIGMAVGAADATGYVVTAATGDILKVANSSSGTSVTYDIVIIGASA